MHDVRSEHPGTPGASTKTVREYGADDHDSINSKLLHLSQVVEHADAKTIAKIFNDVGNALRAHLSAEERAFGFFEADHPWEIRRLREDHDGFRRTLDALLVLAELRMLPPETVHAFIRQLKEHARREDASLYSWAEGKNTVHQPLVNGFVDYLRGRITRKIG